MCMVSYVGTEWNRSVPIQYPFVQPWIQTPVPTISFTESVSREEFEALKHEIEELKKLLIAAKQFDAATGQPDCEMDEKVALIKRLADLVGVDLSEVLEMTP